MATQERWSTRTLSERIDSQLFERTAISKKPDQTISQELQCLRDSGQVNQNMILKDPYVLDFLGLNDSYLEKDLEDAILRELAKHEQEADENPPLGIILCADKKQEQVELLEMDKSGIHVAEYLTVLPSKAELKQKLHQAVINAKLRLDNKE